MRLLMCGPTDPEANRMTTAVFGGIRGQKMMITGGGAEQGSEMITTHGHLVEDLVMWFRRNLTAYHLAWIKEIAPTATPKE